MSGSKKFGCLLLVLASLPFSHQTLANSLTGNCVQTETIPYSGERLGHIGQLEATDSYAPFHKSLQTYGITLVADQQLADNFMQQVAKTIEEMFRVTQFTNQQQQKQLLAHLYQYQAVIPLFNGEPDISSQQEQQLDNLISKHSICDIIMANIGRGQVMEVVEHILHIITDVGLHYSFPRQWGLSTHSQLYKSMQTAIDKGYYQIESYHDIEDEAEKNRILLQEYAYWLISTAWDLQQAYGPHEDEWQIKSAAELQQKLPEAYQLYQTTVARVLTRPRIQTLEQFNQ